MSKMRTSEHFATHSADFIRAGTLEELRAAGKIVVRGARCPLLVVYDHGKVFALDNRCPHLGFPLHRGSVEDGILTCHWHHARFDLASGCTFDLWADDVPTAI
jgi:nitrite reductase/ring-hydroxylating ferredoxin subunit